MIVAVDTGGTKTLIATMNAHGEIVSSVKFPTPKDPAAYLSALIEQITLLADITAITAISVALPGTIKQGVAVWCNNLGWKNFSIKEPLMEAFSVPIFVENDANLAGLAETRQLTFLPRSSLYVTISTGIGTGVITDGTIDPGLRYSEGGRALVEYGGLIQEWEDFASGNAIATFYNKMGSEIDDPLIWYAISERISRGFLALIPFMQPDVIIIGGSMGTHFSKYADSLRTILSSSLPPHIPCPKLIAAAHPEEAVIYGCYLYADDQLA
ncbi:ROK family protein [Candidatus Saccharibacteria bacterium]|nr:ROK family protein [Candidatus Saccharibacteria bacterium]